MLELKGVKKVYETKSGPVYALNGVDLVFPSTGMVFVVGKSGCGKTTLLNVIGGLDGVDEGEISVLGRSFSDFSASDYDGYRNTFIGFIFQEYNLLPEYTVEKNIKLAMELQGSAVEDEELEELLKTVEIQDLKNRKPGELSGGQRQRVAIARALIKKPRIIMADEPTGALDSKTGEQVFDILKKLSKEKLVIIVSHDNESAEKYADRIIRLVDGKVSEDLTYSDKEIHANVKDTDQSFIVKDGAKLNDIETKALVSAIEQRKKIEIIENLSFRERQETGEVKKVVSDKPVELTKSKMKLKSALSMSLKSLTVKPFRLIITILLSAIAFAVFGLFDTVANFNNARVVKNLLSDSPFPTLMVSAQYLPEKSPEDSYSVKLSNEFITDIENTGYSAKGVFDFYDNIIGVLERNYCIQSVSSGLSTQNGISNKSSRYYSTMVNGLVEFSAQEINDNEFGISLIHGEYPVLEYNNKTGAVITESMEKVAISSYLAESIVNALKGVTLNEKEFNSIEDLIGCDIYVNGTNYTVVGIVNVGEIPQKYQALKVESTVSNIITLSLDFSTFISSGAYKCLFVGDGYLEQLNKESNGTTLYYSGGVEWDVKTGTSKTYHAQPYVFSANGYNQDNVLLFSKNYAQDKSIQLKDNEVLVHPRNLSTLFAVEIKNLSLEDSKVVEDLIAQIENAETGDETVKEKFNTLLEKLSISYDKNIEISFKTQSQTTIRKELKVVGVFHGVEKDKDPASATNYLFMMTNNLMSELNVYAYQGEYNKVLLGGNGGSQGRGTLANMLVAETGLKLDLYGNSALQTIATNADTVRQTADLFLYIAILLASFSIFMFFNYIATSILNKRPSIGVLRGLGSGSKDIFTTFTGESLIIAIINAVLAVVLSAIGCIFVNMYISNVMNISIAFAIFGMRQVLIIFAMSILTAIVSSILPILKISKEKPVDLIRKI